MTHEAGIASNAISSGKSRHSYPTAETAVKIAKTLGVTVEYLVTGEHPKGYIAPKLKNIIWNRRYNRRRSKTVLPASFFKFHSYFFSAEIYAFPSISSIQQFVKIYVNNSVIMSYIILERGKINGKCKYPC